MAGTCGMVGGRRSSRKTRKSRAGRSRKMRGGMGYGFGGTIGTAGPEWNSSWGGEITKSGQPVYDTADPQRGSSRRRVSRASRASRASRKSKSKSKKTRKMKGGASYQNVASVGAAFTGTGSRGLADYTPYASKSGGPAQGPDGVHKA